MADITIKRFVKMLCEAFLQCGLGADVALLDNTFLHTAHIRGWLEDQDERFPNQPLNHRTAARIIHNFMRIVLSIPDLPDISPATKLADLYTCHACVNHVAQIFCRGIMSSAETERDGKIFEIFDMLASVTESEAREILAKINTIYYTFL